MTLPRRAARSEQGTTLVELLVTMMIMGVIAFAVMMVFNTMQRATRFGENELQSQQVARTSIERVARSVRQATLPPGRDVMFDVADADRLIFYAQYDDDAEIERVRYDLDGSTLSMWVAQPDCSVTPCTYPSWSTLTPSTISNDILNSELAGGACSGFSSDEPVFRYYRRSGGNKLEELSAPVDPVLRSTVASVRVTLFADLTPEQAPECRQLDTVVHLRNWRD